MTDTELRSQMKDTLEITTSLLKEWLQQNLPRVTDLWWQELVMPSLTQDQFENGVCDLLQLDLPTLIRITNRTWYAVGAVLDLPSAGRDSIRELQRVRSNWSRDEGDLPGKDTTIQDLKTIRAVWDLLGAPVDSFETIDQAINAVEESRGLLTPDARGRSASNLTALDSEPVEPIPEKTIIYIVGEPEKHGVVFSATALGKTIKYEVFVDNSLKTYYSGQIAPVTEETSRKWLDIDLFRSYLAAFQINHPSGQNLHSLNAARIDFVPYQFRPALKLIHSDEPRILIADSVGVGKTIEAGLIIKELEARGELDRVVVICPKPLVAERKWELEMKRFDEEFVPLDGKTFRRILSDTDRDKEWPVRYNKVILPYSVLDSRAYLGEKEGSHRTTGLTELDPAPHFDLVIVDEAHHIRKGSLDKEKAFAYKCTKFFCDHADAVVMLTATPLQTGDDDLFTVLNVLRPDLIIDEKTFQMMSRPNEYIFNCVHQLRNAEPGWATHAKEALQGITKTQWGENVIAEDPRYVDILHRLDAAEISREERVRLISDVESLHSFSSLINRTRRKDIQDFCVRHPHTVEVEFTPQQQELHDELLSFERQALSTLHDTRSVPFMMTTIRRQASSCIMGLGDHVRDIINRRFQQIDDPTFDLDDGGLDEASAFSLSQMAKRLLELSDALPPEDPKFDKLIETIEKKQAFDNNKIMVFSSFRHTLAYLRKRLLDRGLRVEQIDGSVNDETRCALRARFERPKADPKALDILLFTEVGSEGLDYQFCDLMVNYDLPWNPMQIEQRIGRIDRRGQKSEAVNIYNIITSGTIDADIYYRCLWRIGIFEKSIGECEEILGEIASQINSIATDMTLSDAERRKKLEQMADNEVRKVQELDRLEEQEKELFGFNLSEYRIAEEIRRAENPWLTQQSLQKLVLQYLQERIGAGTHLLGEGSLKTIRLSASARLTLRDDERKLPGKQNNQRKVWDQYLSGKTPTHAITFDPSTAEKERESIFVNALHPLARQAAAHFSSDGQDPMRVCLEYCSDSIPEGNYCFSVYGWHYIGLDNYYQLVPVCEIDAICDDLPDILVGARNGRPIAGAAYDWDALEAAHIDLWMAAREQYKKKAATNASFKMESLGNSHRSHVKMLEQRILDSIDESIKRMYVGELDAANESHEKKINEIKARAKNVDIHTSLLANGIISIKKG